LEDRLVRIEKLLATRVAELHQTRQQQQQTLLSLNASEQQVKNARGEIQQLQTKNKQGEEELAARIENLSQLRQQQQQTLTSLNTSKQQVEIAQAAIQNLQQKNKQSEEELANSQLTLQEKDAAITASERTQAELEAQIEKIEQELTSFHETENKLTSVQSELENRDREFVALQQKDKEGQQKLASYQNELDNKKKELEVLQKKDVEGHEKLLSLQGEFDKLDKKYQKLLRPARSEKNKHVVRVVLKKISGKQSYQIADQGKLLVSLSTRSKLEQALSKLKQKYADDLYVKIIIPESSAISHSEAWKFTSDILKRYDYYHSDSDEN